MSPITSTTPRRTAGARVKQKGGALFRRVFPDHQNDAGRRLNQLNQIQIFETILRRHDRSWRQFRSILEFGCGYGRLTRHLFALAPEAEIFGTDVSAHEIAWCRRAYPSGHFTINQPKPPLSLPDAQCDLIFSYSVFTHLSEQNHKDWLRELARILRPGGFMLHTTHSALCLRLIDMFSPERLPKYGLGASVEEFIASGKEYHYVPETPTQPEYGMTILSPAYVMQRWPAYSGLRVVEYVEGAIAAFPEGCQDVVVLTKAQGV